MDKQTMREYVAAAETRIDDRLNKWKKISRIENGDVVQIEWQFEQSRIMLNIFWYDADEHVSITCSSPSITWQHTWNNLDPMTMTKVMDRIGNFAQIVSTRMINPKVE